eukprot:2150808-Pyramimonas_sp.AAC.1
MSQTPRHEQPPIRTSRGQKSDATKPRGHAERNRARPWILVGLPAARLRKARVASEFLLT